MLINDVLEKVDGRSLILQKTKYWGEGGGYLVTMDIEKVFDSSDYDFLVNVY